MGVADAAFLELLASYEAALDEWKRTHETARRLRDLVVAGKPVSPNLMRMIDAALDHDEGQLRGPPCQGGAVQIVVSDALTLPLEAHCRPARSTSSLCVAGRRLAVESCPWPPSPASFAAEASSRPPLILPIVRLARFHFPRAVAGISHRELKQKREA